MGGRGRAGVRGREVAGDDPVFVPCKEKRSGSKARHKHNTGRLRLIGARPGSKTEEGRRV